MHFSGLRLQGQFVAGKLAHRPNKVLLVETQPFGGCEIDNL